METAQINTELVGTILVILAFALLIVLSILFAANQKKKVIEWLKYAVSEAEKELGRYTGQLKLHKVYGWYVERFPIIASFVSFDAFSFWVDKALETMNQWLNNKNAISNYIRPDIESVEKDVDESTEK